MDQDVRRRALGYPYAAPTRDCVWTQRGASASGRRRRCRGGRLEFRGREPARQTNARPCHRLQSRARAIGAKIQGLPETTAVVLARARLDDFDIVYGAGIAGYGAVGGATLAHSPGTSVEAWVTWLDDEQLQKMHETEGLVAGVYGYFELQQISLRFASGPVWTSVLAYVQRAGALNLGGAANGARGSPSDRAQVSGAPSAADAGPDIRDRFAPFFRVTGSSPRT